MIDLISLNNLPAAIKKIHQYKDHPFILRRDGQICNNWINRFDYDEYPEICHGNQKSMEVKFQSDEKEFVIDVVRLYWDDGRNTPYMHIQATLCLSEMKIRIIIHHANCITSQLMVEKNWRNLDRNIVIEDQRDPDSCEDYSYEEMEQMSPMQKALHGDPNISLLRNYSINGILGPV